MINFRNYWYRISGDSSNNVLSRWYISILVSWSRAWGNFAFVWYIVIYSFSHKNQIHRALFFSPSRPHWHFIVFTSLEIVWRELTNYLSKFNQSKTDAQTLVRCLYDVPSSSYTPSLYIIIWLASYLKNYSKQSVTNWKQFLKIEE